MVTDSSGRVTLAELLRRFREQRGMTRRAVSQRAGLSDSYMGKFEAGDIDSLSVSAFVAISCALELSAYEALFCIRCAIAEHRADVGEGAIPFT